jgi:hypothetical protein
MVATMTWLTAMEFQLIDGQQSLIEVKKSLKIPKG